MPSGGKILFKTRRRIASPSFPTSDAAFLKWKTESVEIQQREREEGQDEAPLGLFGTVGRGVSVQDFDHGSSELECFCYGWKVLVPTRQAGEKRKEGKKSGCC